MPLSKTQKMLVLEALDSTDFFAKRMIITSFASDLAQKSDFGSVTDKQIASFITRLFKTFRYGGTQAIFKKSQLFFDLRAKYNQSIYPVARTPSTVLQPVSSPKPKSLTKKKPAAVNSAGRTGSVIAKQKTAGLDASFFKDWRDSQAASAVRIDEMLMEQQEKQKELGETTKDLQEIIKAQEQSIARMNDKQDALAQQVEQLKSLVETMGRGPTSVCKREYDLDFSPSTVTLHSDATSLMGSTAQELDQDLGDFAALLTRTPSANDGPNSEGDEKPKTADGQGRSTAPASKTVAQSQDAPDVVNVTPPLPVRRTSARLSALSVAQEDEKPKTSDGQGEVIAPLSEVDPLTAPNYFKVRKAPRAINGRWNPAGALNVEQTKQHLEEAAREKRRMQRKPLSPPPLYKMERVRNAYGYNVSVVRPIGPKLLRVAKKEEPEEDEGYGNPGPSSTQ